MTVMGRADGAGTAPADSPGGLDAAAAQNAAAQAVTLNVQYDGVTYPAEEVARGAAYELFADLPATGFLPNPRPGARHRYRRFVHAVDVTAVAGGTRATEQIDQPLVMPVSRTLHWGSVHRMSQTPVHANGAAHAAMIATIRRTAGIRRGTRMVKFLSPRQLAGYLHGWLPSGFCYRAYDVAHLRTPADLAVLRGEPDSGNGNAGQRDVVFAIRWRAVDPRDYAVPLGAVPLGAGVGDAGDGGGASHDFRGLVAMPPHDRVGPPVIGTGFAPTDRHLIPEFVTADLADLPLTANAALVAYTGDGSEVTLYTYLPEQRAWTRMSGPQWRHLVAGLPGSSTGPFPLDQEYFPISPAMGRFVGRYRGELYDAIADPPNDYRVAAKTRAARYPVEALARRTPYATWRGALCTITRAEGDWLRVRLCRPDGETVAKLRAHCMERGIYEAWAPVSEVTNIHENDLWYDL